ncbi:MAG: MFS transporter [Verrucomicrobiae bacterium]|nr:MFS transporter [Verrucomicrobiae bacterium]
MSRLRHRELLLSLKYSTVEASFSVPMLNLTMPSFPFVIGFAITALGFGPAAVGLMAALPHACNLIQPPLVIWLRRRWSLYQIMALSFLCSAAPWGVVGCLPWLPQAQRGPVFGWVLVIATLANSLASVAWSASIAELVPPRLSGRFFGRRNLIFGFWTLLAVVVASRLADIGQNTLITFGWIFAAAGLARLVGFLFLTRMRFPPGVLSPAPEPPNLREIAQPIGNLNYLKLVLFVGTWSLMLNLGQPFYTGFLIEGLHRPMGDVGLLTAIAGVGALLTLKGWGRLCDHFGNKPVLSVCSLVWALVSLASWSLAGERFFWHLAFCFLVVGATTAGFQLCQFNLMLKLAPANKSPYVAVFLALTSLMTAFGPLLGGALLRLLPDVLGEFLGQPIRDYHVLIALSMVGCLLSTHLLGWVNEAEAHAPEDVWRTMRRMRPFNPMLTLGSAAQLVLTPGGLMGLTRTSWRELRRHARRMTDVGGEIVSGGAQVLRAPLDKSRRKP